MRIFLLKYKQYGQSGEFEDWYALAYAEDVDDALEVAKRESSERFGIRKCGAQDFKAIKVLKKPALLAWASFVPCELNEEEFEDLEGKT